MKTCSTCFPFPRTPKYRRAAAVWDYLLAHTEATAADMATEFGITRHAVTESLQVLKARAVVRIARWHRYTLEESGRRGGGIPAPVWAIGAEPDAPAPRRRSSKQRQRDYYSRNKVKVLTRERKRRLAAGQAERTPVWLRGLL